MHVWVYYKSLEPLIHLMYRPGILSILKRGTNAYGCLGLSEHPI
jgi:hypothetical protein